MLRPLVNMSWRVKRLLALTFCTTLLGGVLALVFWRGSGTKQRVVILPYKSPAAGLEVPARPARATPNPIARGSAAATEPYGALTESYAAAPIDGELLTRKLATAAKLDAQEEQRVRMVLQRTAENQAYVNSISDPGLRQFEQARVAQQVVKNLRAVVPRDKEPAVEAYLRDGVPRISFPTEESL